MNHINTPITKIGKAMSELAMAFDLSPMMQLGKHMNEIAIAQQKSFQPLLDEMKKRDHEMKIIFSSIESSLAPMRELAATISFPKLEWFSQICDISPTLYSPKRKLIEVNGHEITFNLKPTKYRKLESIHRALLIVLLEHSDEKGFISYEQIEKSLRQRGLEAIESIKNSRKRTRNSRDAIMRFLDIPKTYNRIKLIETISKKGLKLNNPMI